MSVASDHVDRHSSLGLVLGAAMRKLVVLCYGVLKSGKPFDPALA